MRKFLVTATFVVAMALGTVASPAAAAPNENANCVAQTFNPLAREDGRGFGDLVSGAAQEAGGVGQFIGPGASSNDCR